MQSDNTPCGASAPATITVFASTTTTTGTRKPITTWRKLFAAFEKAPPPKSSRKQDQPGWCPASFSGDARKKANVEQVFALVFDYDDGRTSPQQALVAWPGTLACTYTSWSHVPDKPRFRLVVPLSRAVNVEEYARVWAASETKLLAAGQAIDQACKDPSRLWYAPCRRDEHFAVAVQEGVLLDVDELLAQVVLSSAPAKATLTSVATRESFAATVKQRSRLEEVVRPSSDWEQRTGNDWWCSSPLRTGDTTPSFHILLDRQVWFDFGLGEGGDVFAYLQKLWGCTFKEALHRQAAAVGILRPVIDFDDTTGIAIEEHNAEIVDAAPPLASDITLDSGRPRFACTDLGNAERLVYRHGPNIRFVPQWDKWIVWTGKHWDVDKKKRVERLAQKTVRAIYGEAKDEADPDRRKVLAEHAKKSEANARKVALLDQAKSLPGIPIAPEDLDADPWLLNVQNGTLDLRTAGLRLHRREDLLMMIAKADYDPTATCPTYDKFLERVQPDATVRDFIWRLDAASMTGVIREHWLAYHYGTGRNGKSVHEEIMLHLLGGYARKIPTELLMAKRGESHPTEKTTLYRIRYAAASETEEGRVMNVAFIKQATGGDMISARRMREDFWEFEPTHHLHISSNHKLIIRETKDAIWERVLLVLWGVQIPREERDVRLGERLKAEASGILTKLAQHCLAWQRDGLQVPRAVRIATDEYREEMDVLGDFIDTWCIEDAKRSDTAAHLYDVYKSWAEDGGEYVLSQTLFGRQLGDRGFIKERCTRTGRVVWRGLRVRTAADATTAPEHREPGEGMAVDTRTVTEILDEMDAAEQSEQFDRENRIATHEAVILAETGIEPQTIQTIQSTSIASVSLAGHATASTGDATDDIDDDDDDTARRLAYRSVYGHGVGDDDEGPVLQ